MLIDASVKRAAKFRRVPIYTTRATRAGQQCYEGQMLYPAAATLRGQVQAMATCYMGVIYNSHGTGRHRSYISMSITPGLCRAAEHQNPRFFLLNHQYMGMPVSISTMPMAASRGRTKMVLKKSTAQNSTMMAGTTG